MTSLLERLGGTLGPKGCLTEANDIQAYITDLLGLDVAAPLCVTRPATTAEVAETVRCCREHAVAVIPQGGNTGLCGGAVPLDRRDTVIVALDRLKSIREVDPAGNIIVAESGVVLADVQAAAAGVDRIFPLTHGGEASSRIGGNLSTNAGGNNALRYGTARDQVLGLEVVLPSGEVWHGLRALRKNTAGYDLKHLFIGAEGTLGIITAAALKIRPAPKARETVFAALASPAAGLDFLRRLEGHVGEIVTAFELLSANAVSAALSLEGVRYPLAERHDWCALIEVDSASTRFDLQGAVEDALAEGFDNGIVLDAVITQSEAQREDLWRLRESVAFALIEDKSCLKSDTAVPVAAVPEFVRRAEAAVVAAVPGVRCTPFGHLGDGNVHFNVQRPEGDTDAEFKRFWPELADVICGVSLELGGTMSAEHGIGRTKQAVFGDVTPVTEIDLMKKLKAALDPDGLMNPGVLFP